MRTNRLFRSSFPRAAAWPGLEPLAPALARLATSPIREVGGAFVLEELLPTGTHWPYPDDLVGYEAFTNCIHVEDYLDASCVDECRMRQGFLYCEALAAKLRECGLQFRVVLNRDPESDAVTARFYMRRGSRDWALDDIEGYEVNELVYWDE